MLFLVLAKNEDIVNIDDDDGVEFVLKDIVHETHEGRWCIREGEWKDKELVWTVASAKCRLGDVFFIDSDLMISGAQIDFAKDFGRSRSSSILGRGYVFLTVCLLRAR